MLAFNHNIFIMYLQISICSLGDWLVELCHSIINANLRIVQGVSRLVDITAGGDYLGLCDQKSSYKHVSDFGRLRSYDRLKLGVEVNDY